MKVLWKLFASFLKTCPSFSWSYASYAIHSYLSIYRPWTSLYISFPFLLKLNPISFFNTSVCVYQPPREVEWSACSPSTKDQVRTKTLALVKSRLLDGKCPEKKVISKACKNDKNNKGWWCIMHEILIIICFTVVFNWNSTIDCLCNKMTSFNSAWKTLKVVICSCLLRLLLCIL